MKKRTLWVKVIPTVLYEMNVGVTQSRISFLFNYVLACGSLAAARVNLMTSRDYRHGWHWSLAVCGLLAVPVFLVSAFLDETPRFLIKKRRIEEAKKFVKRLRRSGAEAEVQKLAHMIEREDRKPWRKLCHSPVMVINLVAQFFRRVLALDSIMFFCPLLLQSMGYTYHAAFLAPFLVGVVRAGGAGFTLWSYNFFGRRRTLSVSCIGMLLSLISFAGVLYGSDPLIHLGRERVYAAISSVIVFTWCYSLFSGPCDWTEATYPEETKAFGACLEGTISLFMTLVMNFLILHLLCGLKVWIFPSLAAVVLFVGSFIYMLLPEIGKLEGEPPEIDIWRGHSFWKRLLPQDENADGV